MLQFAIPFPSDPPSTLSSPSSLSGASAADERHFTEMEALTATHQGMLHAVSNTTTHVYVHFGVCGKYLCMFVYYPLHVHV